MNVLAFMFASTNLIVELGLMILILFGWEFLLAEILGGLVLIAIMAVLVQWTLPAAVFDEAREALREEAKPGVWTRIRYAVPRAPTSSRPRRTGARSASARPGAWRATANGKRGRGSVRDVVFSWSGWFRLGNQYRKEWSMIWKDVVRAS